MNEIDQASILSDADLDLVNGGNTFKLHLSLFGYKVGIIAADVPNGQMTCTYNNLADRNVTKATATAPT